MSQALITTLDPARIKPTSGQAPQRSIVVPTWAGHKDDVTELIGSIRLSQNAHIEIYLVISEDERALFTPLAQKYKCAIFTIEELVRDHTGKVISGAKLLKLIDRYRFQTLKKFLALARLDGLALLIDSESRVAHDLIPIFEGGLQETTVLYSLRAWDKMPAGLAKDAYEESCHLLGEQPFWYFESLNWLYSTDVVRRLLAELKESHGSRWMFRDKQLFESQLYFQYAHQHDVPYRFIRAEQLLTQHFGETRAVEILSAMYSSPWKAAGIFEYLARFVTRDEFTKFIADESMLRHFRLVRYEPYGFFDVVGQLRSKIERSPYFFGEAAMHRGPFVRGKTAVLLFGDLYVEQDIFNVQQFLAGVDCDIFLVLPANNWLTSLADDLLQPKRILKLNVRPVSQSAKLVWRVASRVTSDDRPFLSGVILTEFLNAAHRAMIQEEQQCGDDYAVVICMRPQLASVRRLRDILWDASEKTSGFANKVLVPNRYWCDGINAHLLVGLRSPMGRLLRATEQQVPDAESTIERVLAVSMTRSSIQPIPIPLQYFLADDGYPDLRHMTRRFRWQSSGRWTGKVSAPTWRDATDFLSSRLASRMQPPRRSMIIDFWNRRLRNPLKIIERTIRRSVRKHKVLQKA